MIHMFEEIPTKHSSLIHWDYHMRICLNQHIWEVEVQPNTFNWWWLTRCLDHLNVEAKVKSSWESESYPPSKLPFAEPTNGLTAPPIFPAKIRYWFTLISDGGTFDRGNNQIPIEIKFARAMGVLDSVSATAEVVESLGFTWRDELSRSACKMWWSKNQ